MELGVYLGAPWFTYALDLDESNIILILRYSPILFSFPSLSSPLHFFIRPHP
jgi:hypothetical protein